MRRVKYEMVLYKTDAVLHEAPCPNPDNFTHAVLVLHEVPTAEAKHTSLQFTSKGVMHNVDQHIDSGGGWFWCPDKAIAGYTYQSGLLPVGLTIASMVAKAVDGTWIGQQFKNNNEDNCFGFVRDLVKWAFESYHRSSSSFSLTNRLPQPPPGIAPPPTHVSSSSSSQTISSSSSLCNRLVPPLLTNNAPLPLPTVSDDVVANCLNSALLTASHGKEELIGYIFKHSSLTTAEVHALLPAVSLSTIKHGLQKANDDTYKLELEVKRHDHAPRNHLRDWEAALFKKHMMPFFMQPNSGSRATKTGLTVFRCNHSKLFLWAKYLAVLPLMVRDALEGKFQDKITDTPRSYEFFHHHLLSMIRYKQERNLRRCHYCDSLNSNKTARSNLIKNRDNISVAKYVADLEVLESKIRKGELHKARWHRQNGFIHYMKNHLIKGQACCMIDYFSFFYTYTFKVNVLAFVNYFLDADGTSQVEHYFYVSKNKHDFVFTGVAFQHAFDRATDFFVNAHGPKYTDIVFSGDTAMFSGPILCCLRHIVVTAGCSKVRCVPLCTKHGANECDGDAGRVARKMEELVLENALDETQPAEICSLIVNMMVGSIARAFPLFGLIDMKRDEIHAMLPMGSQKTGFYSPGPGRKFGEILLTVPYPFSIWCRTDVNVDEPWWLEKKMGYPLPPGMAAPVWLLVDMATNPTKQCIPCALLQLMPVPKSDDHTKYCMFKKFTKHKRCGLCGKRDGHTARNCANNPQDQPMTLLELQNICRGLNCDERGTREQLLARIAKHSEDDVAEPDVGSINLVDVDAVDSDISELSDEKEIE